MTIRIAIAPDSWGVWFPDHVKQPAWTRTISEMSEAGYKGIELGPWGYFPTNVSELRDTLDSHKLCLVAGTTGCNFLDDDSVDAMCKQIDDIAATLSAFNEAKYIVLLPAMYTDLETGEAVMDKELTDEQWRHYCANVQRASDHVAALGLVGTFHPHVDCHVETEEEIERLLADTTVSLCLDTGHHVYGGGYPVEFYEEHADRIPYLHIKDCDMMVKARMDEEKWSFARAVTEGIMTEPGKGAVDLARLHSALTENNYHGWITVEQDLFPVASFDIPLPLAKAALDNLIEAGFTNR